MIDTNKYEGHTEGPWWCNEDDWRCIDTMIKHEKGKDLQEICRVFYREVDYDGKPLPNPVGFNRATAQLIADAPLLLAEVKRLRSLGMGTDTDGTEATGWVKKINSLNAEVKRLREGIKAYLNLEIETHELKEMIE